MSIAEERIDNQIAELLGRLACYDEEFKIIKHGSWTIKLDAVDAFGDNTKFINWALDELAKRTLDFSLDASSTGGWYVCYALRNGPYLRDRDAIHPTKTLALAHALIEVNRG